MRPHHPNLKLFVIDPPYECWQHPEIEELFYNMVMIKKKGYEANYDNLVLPVDTTDFISTHVLLCASTPTGSSRPVMGYKVTSLSKAQEYDITFPGLSLVQKAGSLDHVKAIESIIDNCERLNRPLAYLGSWTVDPDFKNMFNTKTTLREVFIATYRQLFLELGSPEVVIGGTIRFGTQKLFAELGHQPLNWQGKELGPIHVTHLAGEPVQVMHSPTNMLGFEDIVQKYQSLWSEREHISRHETKGKRAA